MKTDVGRQPNKRTRHSGRLLPALCNALGTLLMVAVILTALPLTVPRLFGFDIYHVLSGSMEPALPVGSVVYVETVQPEAVKPDDVIAFLNQGTVVTHRVVRNRIVEGDFITKGDANGANDPAPISYGALVGRMVFHVPYIGALLSVYENNVGKLYVLMVAASGLMLNMLGNRIRERRKEAARRSLRREVSE